MATKTRRLPADNGWRMYVAFQHVLKEALADVEKAIHYRWASQTDAFFADFPKAYIACAHDEAAAALDCLLTSERRRPRALRR